MEGVVVTSSSEVNATTKGVSDPLDDAALAEVNFEELIKATNVTPRILESGFTDEETSQNTDKKSVNQLKYIPKTNASVKNSSGQVVIIQSSSGTQLPIRIAGSNVNNTLGKQGTPVTIQVLKMSDGNVLQLKNNKTVSIGNLSNVTQLSTNIKKSVTTTNSGTIVKTSAGTSSLLGQSSVIGRNMKNGTQIVKSVAISDPHRVTAVSKAKSSEINCKPIAKIISASPGTTNPVSAVVSPNTTANKQSAQKLILPADGKEIRIKTDQETGAKQILIPQHILKLSPNSPGAIQAIQIPGKAGLQYVRVLGTTSSSSGKSLGTPITAIRNKDLNTTKMTVIPQVVSNSKIVVGTTKANSTGTAVIVNKESGTTPTSNTIQVSGKQQTMKSITTVPTLKKIESTITKTFTMAVKRDDKDVNNADQGNKTKISQLNQQIKKFSNDRETHTTAAVQNQDPKAKLLTLMQPQQQVVVKVSQQMMKSASSESVPQKKLYSILKPSTETLVEKTPPPVQTIRKRSPSPEGVRRKHCNCTKSQCLKLYCDCFANGEFCQDCNCKECFNNLDYEDERQKAIRICLERNPNAFKPKITKARDQSDLRLHNKGCNCKRSGCLKNYCECYEAKITCSSNCKCYGCRNIEDRSEIDPLEVAKIAQSFGRGVATKRSYTEMADKTPVSTSSELQAPLNKQPYSFITQEVVDATIQCMIAQADDCKKSGINSKNTEKMILEELGRCLVEIIHFSIRNMDN